MGNLIIPASLLRGDGMRLSILLLICAGAFSPQSGHGQVALIIHEQEYTSQSLSGTVQIARDPTGVEGVLVEICEPGWTKVVASAVTDERGQFSFPNFKERKLYFVRLSAKNFNTLQVKIRLKADAQESVTLKMELGT